MDSLSNAFIGVPGSRASSATAPTPTAAQRFQDYYASLRPLSVRRTEAERTASIDTFAEDAQYNALRRSGRTTRDQERDRRRVPHGEEASGERDVGPAFVSLCGARTGRAVGGTTRSVTGAREMGRASSSGAGESLRAIPPAADARWVSAARDDDWSLPTRWRRCSGCVGSGRSPRTVTRRSEDDRFGSASRGDGTTSPSCRLRRRIWPMATYVQVVALRRRAFGHAFRRMSSGLRAITPSCACFRSACVGGDQMHAPRPSSRPVGEERGHSPHVTRIAEIARGAPSRALALVESRARRAERRREGARSGRKRSSRRARSVAHVDVRASRDRPPALAARRDQAARAASLTRFHVVAVVRKLAPSARRRRRRSAA